MRHWFIWYHVRGKHAHRINFHKELDREKKNKRKETNYHSAD